MIKIAIFGAAGRMGGELLRNLSAFPELLLTAAVDRADHPAQGQDSGVLSGCAANGVALSPDAETAVCAADVIIDFTFHATIPATAALVRAHRKAYVIGTTALSPEEKSAVDSVAEVAPVILASNMSLGVNLLAQLVRKAASVLPFGYDIEIVEMHHRHKKDAPSGTALTLAEAAAEGRGQKLSDVLCCGREGITGERDEQTIAIHALRGGDVVGDHTVIFAADGERVELSHKASSRRGFAVGALRAAQWLAAQAPGYHTMAEMLSL